MRPTSSLLLFLMVSLCSCRKEIKETKENSELTIYGKVTDKITGQPLPGGGKVVAVVHKTRGSNPANPDQETGSTNPYLGESQIDANGKFNIAFQPRDNASCYGVQFIYNDSVYKVVKDVVNVLPEDFRRNMYELNKKAIRYAMLNIHFRNENPVDNQDRLLMTMYTGYLLKWDNLQNCTVPFIPANSYPQMELVGGANASADAWLRLPADLYTHFSWGVWRKGILQKSGYDTILCKTGETRDYTFNY